MKLETILVLLAALTCKIAALKTSVSPLIFRNRQVMMIFALCFKNKITLHLHIYVYLKIHLHVERQQGADDVFGKLMKSKNALLVAGILALSPLPSSAFVMEAPFKSITVPGLDSKINFFIPLAKISFNCPETGEAATATVS
jgi:hypothetical protein